MPLPLRTPPKSICLLRLSAIGDVTHVVPVVRQLLKQWPETSITWIIGKTEHELVKDIDQVDYIVFDKKKGLGAFSDLWRKLKGRQFDVLLNMQVSLRAGFASLLVTAPVRIGFDRTRAKNCHQLFINTRIAENPGNHVLDGFFDFLDVLGLKHDTPTWDIPIPAAAYQSAMTLIGSEKQYIVINPSSSTRVANWRNWAAEKYARGAEYAFEQYGLICVLTGGPSEQEKTFAETIISYINTPTINLAGRTTLKELLALLDRATLVISPDTGPAHMANAVGTPVIGLYATSNPERTGPYNSRNFTVNRYPDALLKFHDKKTNDVPWGKRVRDPAAMDLISLTDVTDKIDQAMKTRMAQHNESASIEQVKT